MSLALASIIYYAKLRYVVFITLGFKASPVSKSFSPLLLCVEADTMSRTTNLTSEHTSKIIQGTSQFHMKLWSHVYYRLNYEF